MCPDEIQRGHHLTQTLILGVFVDILCLGTSMDLISWFRTKLANQFSITIKINVDSFLGMQIYRDRSAKLISLSQPGYISTIMDKFKIDINSKTSYPPFPMSSSDLLDPSPIYLSPLEQSLYMISLVLFYFCPRVHVPIYPILSNFYLYLCKKLRNII